jgi:hypothetical protein
MMKRRPKDHSHKNGINIINLLLNNELYSINTMGFVYTLHAIKARVTLFSCEHFRGEFQSRHFKSSRLAQL